MLLFKILYGVDIIVGLIFLYFFFVGMADNTVNEKNFTLWVLILAVIGGVLYASQWLSSNNHTTAAYGVVSVVAVPAILATVALLIMIISKTKWN